MRNFPTDAAQCGGGRKITIHRHQICVFVSFGHQIERSVDAEEYLKMFSRHKEFNRRLTHFNWHETTTNDTQKLVK